MMAAISEKCLELVKINNIIFFQDNVSFFDDLTKSIIVCLGSFHISTKFPRYCNNELPFIPIYKKNNFFQESEIFSKANIDNKKFFDFYLIS